MKRCNLWSAPIVLMTLICAAGCTAETEIAPVSGTVTLQGAPVPKATVRFMPVPREDDPAAVKKMAIGETDAEGKYSLTVFRGPEGALVGPHRVLITTRVVDDNEKIVVRESIPPQYNTRSTLEFDVPSGGTSQADFALTK
ncbi:MAG TPA: hypothetical protein PKC18_02470 [Lacipirellulaceae bacterium]|nr:hypothetical protein [Lacipirellulaceae bacterium]HMP06974.1 hypothetical protein [Lacipirellulaceae bacterium]